MVALQIRDVPEEVSEALKAKAAAAGQSLQAYLLQLVEREATRVSNAAILARFRGRADGVPGEPGETSRLLTEAREERDSTLERWAHS